MTDLIPTEPAEHCGDILDLPSEGDTTECVLRPGHSGSHANETGTRWRLTAPVPVAHATPSSSEEGESGCALPGFMSCDCNHIDGCQHPTPAPVIAEGVVCDCGHPIRHLESECGGETEPFMEGRTPAQQAAVDAPAPEPGLREPHANPPGSTQEQLPPAVLALIDTGDYLSTACDTALRLERAPAPTPTSGGAIPNVAWYVEQMHARCRRNHKFTGQPCICRCHRETT